MNKNLVFDFAVDKDQNRITVKREFAAELPMIWDAYTKSEILDQWWAPRPWKSRTKSMDFREGGQWHYSMVGPEGEEHWALAKYLRIQKHQFFTGLDCFADAEGNINKELPESSWNVNFTDRSDSTQVDIQISFSDFAQLETTLKMGFKEGLSLAMEGLDQLLETLKK